MQGSWEPSRPSTQPQWPRSWAPRDHQNRPCSGRSRVAPCLQADGCSGLLEPTVGSERVSEPELASGCLATIVAPIPGAHRAQTLAPSLQGLPGAPSRLLEARRSWTRALPPWDPHCGRGARGGLHLRPSTGDPLSYRWSLTHTGLLCLCLAWAASLTVVEFPAVCFLGPTLECS